MSPRRHRPNYQADFSRYFQDELKYLEELGAEHARRDPGRSHFDFAAVNDPDVLCLLQGFSFLTARIRQNLDDELPEVSHTLLGLLFPHFLRSVPAMTVVQFAPNPGAVQSKLTIPHGTLLEARPVDDVACRFRTTSSVDVTPLALTLCRLERSGAREAVVRMRFSAVGPADLAKVDLRRIRLYLRGADEDARTLLWLFSTQVTRVAVEWTEDPEGKIPRRIERAARDSIQSVGFECDEPDVDPTCLLPYPPRSFGGFRLLQEYFALPSKFHFIDLVLGDPRAGLLFGATKKLRSFDVTLFLPDVPPQMPQVDETRIALHCTPVVNLFPHDADPMVLDHSRTEYVVRPRDGGRRNYEVWSVERVRAIEPSVREIPSLFEPHPVSSAPPGAALYHEPRIRPATLGYLDSEADDLASGSTDTYLRFVNGDYEPFQPQRPAGPAQAAGLPDSEKLSIDLLCTNRYLPLQLDPADICIPIGDLPSGVTFRAIERLTTPVAPPMGDLALWRLLSHLALTRLSLADADALRGMLEVYDFQARVDRQSLLRSRKRLAALRSVQARSEVTFLGGTYVPVVVTSLELDAEGFMGVGDIYLFGAVLDRFMAHYVAVNCCSRLVVRVPTHGLEIEYPTRSGAEAIS